MLYKKEKTGSSRRGSVVMNPTCIREDVGLIPGFPHWVKGSGATSSCGVGCRRGSDLVLLWLWCRLGATALIRPLAWEPPHAVGAALKKKNKEYGYNLM